MSSNPNQLYESVRFKAPNRSMQNLSHTYKSTTAMGPLHPILCIEVFPGDVARVNTQIFMRSVPLISPMLHEVDCYVHYFYVPFRLIWDDYEKFLIPQDGETAETIPAIPYFLPKSSLFAYMQKNGLLDYIGIPPVAAATDLKESPSDDQALVSLPLRAYQLIWNEYYRDQNLQDPIDFSKDSGEENYSNFYKIASLRYRAWEKDYFTSCLPRPQKNDPIGFQINATPSERMNVQLDLEDGSARQIVRDRHGDVVYGNKVLGGDPNFLYGIVENGVVAPGSDYAFLDPNGSLYVQPEGSEGTFLTIEMLRESMRLQEFMEQLMRGGSRYAEVVRNMFNTIPDDLRIGRPAYLGGGKQNLVVSEVLQQSVSTETSPLGQMGGHMLSVGSNNRFKALFKEHGYVLGIMSIRPRSAYGQGVDKMFMKKNRYDFPWPAFVHLGEQPVLKGELYFSYQDGKNREEFGYQPMYTEYRTKASTVHGDLRDSMDYWTLNRKFASRPELNADFVTVKPSDTGRIFALSGRAANALYVEADHSIKMVRAIPRDGNPTL